MASNNITIRVGDEPTRPLKPGERVQVVGPAAPPPRGMGQPHKPAKGLRRLSVPFGTGTMRVKAPVNGATLGLGLKAGSR